MDLEELKAIATREYQQQKTCIRCCTVGGCLSANGLTVKEQLEEAVNEARMAGKIAVSGVGCMGLCSKSPLVKVDPAGTLVSIVFQTCQYASITSLNSRLGDCERIFSINL